MFSLFYVLFLETIPYGEVIKYSHICIFFQFLNFAFYIQLFDLSRIDFSFHMLRNVVVTYKCSICGWIPFLPVRLLGICPHLRHIFLVIVCQVDM